MGYVLRVRLASFFAGAATASVAGLYLLHKDYKIAHEAVSQQADVMRLIDDFNNKSLNWRLNTTLISIIPKVKERYQIMDFRSIGLLSSIYKVKGLYKTLDSHISALEKLKKTETPPVEATE